MHKNAIWRFEQRKSIRRFNPKKNKEERKQRPNNKRLRNSGQEYVDVRTQKTILEKKLGHYSNTGLQKNVFNGNSMKSSHLFSILNIISCLFLYNQAEVAWCRKFEKH